MNVDLISSLYPVIIKLISEKCTIIYLLHSVSCIMRNTYAIWCVIESAYLFGDIISTQHLHENQTLLLDAATCSYMMHPYHENSQDEPLASPPWNSHEGNSKASLQSQPPQTPVLCWEWDRDSTSVKYVFCLC